MKNRGYFVAQDGKPVGPFSFQDLGARISQESLVWREGLADWTLASALDELNIGAELPPPLPGRDRNQRQESTARESGTPSKCPPPLKPFPFPFVINDRSAFVHFIYAAPIYLLGLSGGLLLNMLVHMAFPQFTRGVALVGVYAAYGIVNSKKRVSHIEFGDDVAWHAGAERSFLSGKRKVIRQQWSEVAQIEAKPLWMFPDLRQMCLGNWVFVCNVKEADKIRRLSLQINIGGRFMMAEALEKTPLMAAANSAGLACSYWLRPFRKRAAK